MRDGAGCGADGGEAGRTAGSSTRPRAARVDQVAPTDPAASPWRRHSVTQGRLALLAAFALHALSFVGWFIDDAFITMRYGHNLASGHGMVFNLGERVEGYTDFTWVLLAALSLRLGVDPTLSFPIAGVVCGFGTVASVFATGGRLSRSTPRAAGRNDRGGPRRDRDRRGCVRRHRSRDDALHPPDDAGHDGAARAAYRALRGLHRARVPDPPGGGAPGRLRGGVLRARALLRRASWREFAIGVAILSAIVLPYLGWKLSHSGLIVPNTLYAKAPDRSAGWQYLWPPLAATAGLSPAASLASLRSRERRPHVGFFLALWIFWVLAVWWEGGLLGMPSIRLLVPGIPFVALAADGEILDWVLVARRRPTRVALGVAAALGARPVDRLEPPGPPDGPHPLRRDRDRGRAADAPHPRTRARG